MGCRRIRGNGSFQKAPSLERTSFPSPHRVAESTEEVSSLRPPRLIREDGIIRPYDRGEADGCDLFEVQCLNVAA